MEKEPAGKGKGAVQAVPEAQDRVLPDGQAQGNLQEQETDKGTGQGKTAPMVQGRFGKQAAGDDLGKGHHQGEGGGSAELLRQPLNQRICRIPQLKDKRPQGRTKGSGRPSFLPVSCCQDYRLVPAPCGQAATEKNGCAIIYV